MSLSCVYNNDRLQYLLYCPDNQVGFDNLCRVVCVALQQRMSRRIAWFARQGDAASGVDGRPLRFDADGYSSAAVDLMRDARHLQPEHTGIHVAPGVQLCLESTQQRGQGRVKDFQVRIGVADLAGCTARNKEQGSWRSLTISARTTGA